MLVKILSYTASVVGSARHRAVMASCFVLVVAFAAILSIPLMHAPAVKLIGSAQDDVSTESQTEPVWLSERQQPQKDTQEDTEPKKASPRPNEKPADNTVVAATAPEATEPNENITELSLSKTEIILKPRDLSSVLTARINSYSGETTWSVTTGDSVAAGDMAIVSDEQLESSISFRVRAGENVKTGTYQITVTATSTEFSLTKTLTVIVE